MKLSHNIILLLIPFLLTSVCHCPSCSFHSADSFGCLFRSFQIPKRPNFWFHFGFAKIMYQYVWLHDDSFRSFQKMSNNGYSDHLYYSMYCMHVRPTDRKGGICFHISDMFHGHVKGTPDSTGVTNVVRGSSCNAFDPGFPLLSMWTYKWSSWPYLLGSATASL